jgi:two-component system cell cycle sensor histidine kinase/response regulator CckA
MTEPVGKRVVQAIFDGALDAMLLADDSGRYVEANPAACELLGLPREQLLGRSISDFAAANYSVTDAWQSFVEQGRMRGSFPLLRADGALRELDFSAVANVLPGLHLSILRDMTDSRRDEATLRRLASIIESSDDAIISRDLDGKIRTWNHGAEKLFLYSADEVVGKAISMLYTPEQTPQLLSARERVNDGEPFNQLVMQGVRKDGTRIELSVKASRLVDSDGQIDGVSVIARDISEHQKTQHALHRTEEQLRQSQKMEAVGSLAGGVAHDFNNLLSIILSYTNLIVEDLKPGDPMRGDLEEVYKAGTRAADLTRQLLAFSRQQMLQPSVLDLNQIITGLGKMLTRLLREDISLSVLAGQGLGKVHADPGQIEQVIMNLVVNARDAMPSGGNLTIETANVLLDAEYAAAHHGVTRGQYVMMAVTDTGIGMDRATQDRVFDPFFTTKEKGKGTGLGLSTVYGIVQQSGGHVWIYSEPGAGSAFRVYLPRTDRLVDLRPSQQPAPMTLHGTETVLLVEDEEQVRAIMRTILRKYGYNVLEAQNGGEAFLICEKYTARIHLLLTDVVMPRMSGRALAERLAQLRPEMQVLYVSGYTENSIVHHGVLDAGIAFLPKPITPDALLRKVREVLESNHRTKPTPP